jgi:AcrR family transcriptional regulator
MAQVKKEEVRARILAAALEEFAARGHAGATMAGVAARAGVAAAGIYRYYPGKDELFDAVVPEALVRRFEALLEARVRALAAVAFGRGAEVDDRGEELLRFWLEHRLAVVILLDRAQGTAHARYGERFVTLLVAATLEEIRAVEPGFEPTGPARFVLERIFENTRRVLAAILERHADEGDVRAAIRGFWSYQIPGLRGFAEWARSPAGGSRPG